MKIKKIFHLVPAIAMLWIFNCNVAGSATSPATTTTTTTTTTQPTGLIQSVAFDVTTASLGNTIKPTITLNQPDSTIQAIMIKMTGGEFQTCGALETTTGSGIYQCNYTVQQWDAANFQIEMFYLYSTSVSHVFMDFDSDGIYDEVDPYTNSLISSTSIPLASVAISGTTPDVTPPSINSITVTGTPTGAGSTYLSGDSVTVTVVATDAVSGISTLYSWVDLYTVDNVVQTGFGTFSPTGNPDEYSANIILYNPALQYLNQPVYACVSIADNAGIASYLTYPGSGTTYYNSALTVTTLPVFYNTTPPTALSITVNDPAGAVINVPNGTSDYYSFPVTAGQSYTVLLDDANGGSGSYTGTYGLEIFAMGTPYQSIYWSNYLYGSSFTAASTGTVYIQATNFSAGTANIVVTSP